MTQEGRFILEEELMLSTIWGLRQGLPRSVNHVDLKKIPVVWKEMHVPLRSPLGES